MNLPLQLRLEAGGSAAAARSGKGAVVLALQVPPGLYQVSALWDGRDFDWGRLYRPEQLSDGATTTTGPWDFDVDGLPLLPAFRVEQDGKFAGTWVVQRMALGDLEAQVFRGRMAFRVGSDAPGEVRLLPLRQDRLPWTGLRLETDPEDRLEPPELTGPATACDRWSDEEFWAGRRDLLDTPGFETGRLRRAAAEVMAEDAPHFRMGLVLCCAFRLWGEPEVLERALQLVDCWCGMAAFGRTSLEHAYGYGGDMDAMHALRALVHAEALLRPWLGPERRARIAAQLGRQAKFFVSTALVCRDYWGGSVLQDHGWQSMFGAAAAVLNGRNFIPGAAAMLAYLVPRTMRALEAMPRDGAVGTHSDLWRYVSRLACFRNAWLAASGQDLFAQETIGKIPTYVRQGVLSDGLRRIDPIRDVKPMLGGGAFFLACAERGIPEARELAARTAALPLEAVDHDRLPRAARRLNRLAFFENQFETLLAADAPLEAPGPVRIATGLVHYPDSGVVVARQVGAGLDFSLKCGPWYGWHAEDTAVGPCDRLCASPGAGHFNVVVDGTPVLVTPEMGWQARSDLRSCLLIDGIGQIGGNHAYANSIPAFEHPGMRILACDEEGDGGMVVLDLGSAYPESLGVLCYRREFVFAGDGSIRCSDRIELAEPRKLRWLFHTTGETAPREIAPACCRLGNLLLTCRMPQAVATATEKTRIVRYLPRDTGRDFVCLAFELRQPTASLCMDFHLERG